MQDINPDQAAHVVVEHFLSSLMKIERERLGLSRSSASVDAGWPRGAWGELERGARTLKPHYWMQAAVVLDLGPEELVRRLNAFIGKNPGAWLERTRSGRHSYCERPITSPRAMRSGKVVGLDLNQLRPELYHELSSYSHNPAVLFRAALNKGFITAEEPKKESAKKKTQRETRLERIHRAVDELPAEKLGLLERVLDKFKRFPARDLAHGYQHFSLSVSKH